MKHLISLLLLVLCAAKDVSAISARCERLISLAPSITETVFALGLGRQLVGVTRYCAYPDEAKALPKVGGYLDINLEALLQKKPSAVLLLNDHVQVEGELTNLGVPWLEVSHRSVTGIIDSIDKISSFCDVSSDGERLHNQIQSRLDHVAQLTRDLPKIRTLIVVDRESDKSSERVFISGEDGFYTELLKIAGGENVFKGSTAALPSLSAEGLLALSPEVIVEVIPDLEKRGWSRDKIVESWRKISFGRNYKVLFLEAKDADIPGPRVTELVEKLASLLHPGLGDISR